MKDMTWILSAVDQRVAMIADVLGPTITAMPIVMTTLTEPPEGEDATAEDFERWERTCDNCGAYCPSDSGFLTGQATREVLGTQVIVTFGACPRCAEPTQ